jgi:hypothetical protein
MNGTAKMIFFKKRLLNYLGLQNHQIRKKSQRLATALLVDRELPDPLVAERLDFLQY